MNFRNTYPNAGGQVVHAAKRPRPALSPNDNCIAVFDDRFVSWLFNGDCEDGHEPPVQRRGLGTLVGRVMTGAGLEAGLQRIYWYTDRPDSDLVDGQLVRTIGAAQDAEPLWKTMASDIRCLAERRACEHLLLASDDDRLIEVINEAQLHGLQVHLLVDEAIEDLSVLQVEDPTWAALLSQVDRRIPWRDVGSMQTPVGPRSLRDLDQPRGPRSSRTPMPNRSDSLSDDERLVIDEVVQAWWDGQAEHDRDALRLAMSQSPGIPQEVDRALLLRARERVVRPLSFSEKRLMRERVRGHVFGGTPELEAAPNF
ncbi:MAG: hypothetical protein RI906_1031 [Pseudomonadota bacterium]|jgi:hypothetical protein